MRNKDRKALRRTLRLLEDGHPLTPAILERFPKALGRLESASRFVVFKDHFPWLNRRQIYEKMKQAGAS